MFILNTLSNLSNFGTLCVTRSIPDTCGAICFSKQKPKSTSLPHKDDDLAVRKFQVAENRKEYEFVDVWVDLPPTCHNVPVFDNVGVPGYTTPFVSRELQDSPWKSMNALHGVYAQKNLRIPPLAQIWMEDSEFGRHRLIGSHPIGIQRIKAIPSFFKLSGDMVYNLLDADMTLSQALSLGHLFMVDYSEKLKDIPRKNGGFIAAPTCLFYLNNKGSLQPLAIQLWSNSRGRSIVVSPNDNPHAWTLAKMHFSCAEQQWHFFGQKLPLHHLAAIYATATFKCLSDRHPIRQMLTPHLLGAIPSFNWIEEHILSPDGMADQLFEVGLEGGMTILRRAFRGHVFNNTSFQNDMRNRDVEGLPGYHYGEDGALVWNAIVKYVRSVVEFYYTSPSDITHDHELATWMNQLKSCVPSIPFLQEFTLEPVVQVVSKILWTCTAEQSVYNNDIYNMVGWVPNQPFGLSSPWRLKPTGDITKDDVLAALPSPNRTVAQAKFAGIVAAQQSACCTLLKTYSSPEHAPQVFVDSHAHGLYLTFLERLSDVQSTIENANKIRPIPYTALLPKVITNHIFF
mmetsp:Transcript_132893/g.230444  ORF Transcript_132893/g.230444 Transcript_132893/m.230444 type:complete len:569 (-) Transcript_132893:330-2036(-)